MLNSTDCIYLYLGGRGGDRNGGGRSLECYECGQTGHFARVNNLNCLFNVMNLFSKLKLSRIAETDVAQAVIVWMTEETIEETTDVMVGTDAVVVAVVNDVKGKQKTSSILYYSKMKNMIFLSLCLKYYFSVIYEIF